MKICRAYSHCFLKFLVIFHLCGNIVWISLNNAPPTWDEANHIRHAIMYSHFFTDLTNGNPNFELFRQAYSDPYGPLLRMILGIIFALFGESVKLAQVFSTFIFICCLVAIYFFAIAFEAGNSRLLTSKTYWIASITTGIFSFSELVYAHSRWFLLDLGSTCFFLLSILMLLKSNWMQRRSYVLLGGLFAAFALLTKIQTIVYYVFPCLYVSTALLRKRKITDEQFLNCLFGIMLCIGLVSLWLLPNGIAILNYLESGANIELDHPRGYLNPFTWLFYFKLMVNNALGVIFMMILFYGVALSFFYGKTRCIKFSIYFFVFYYIFLSGVSNKDLRFYYPVLPFVILSGVSGLFVKNYNKVTSHILTFFIGIAFFIKIMLYLSLSFGILLPRSIDWRIYPMNNLDIRILNTKSMHPVSMYYQAEWDFSSLLNELNDLAILKGDEITIYSLINFEHVNPNVLNMYADLRDFDLLAFTGGNEKRSFERMEDLEEFIKRNDYILYTEGDFGPPFQWDKELHFQAQQLIRNKVSTNQARVIRKYIFPSHGIYDPALGQEVLLIQIFE
ncbi:MAG: hypothetical protein KIH69_019200 [Anaerolineae bacterium]|nr:hypothetical protein [Anaerolineae bacterium]